MHIVHIYFNHNYLPLLLSFTGNDQVESPGCQVPCHHIGAEDQISNNSQ